MNLKLENTKLAFVTENSNFPRRGMSTGLSSLVRVGMGAK